MVLAEALLRVPDSATADRLIEDKLAAGSWLDGDVRSTALLVAASAWTLGIAARIIHPGETPETILDSVARRLGLPALRAATRQAMRLIGSHFVIGQSIDEALTRARAHGAFRYSFDMLGEGARTAADADALFRHLCRGHRRDRRSRRQCRLAGASGHFREALGLAPALRSRLARAGHGRVGAGAARTGALGKILRAAIHRRCRRSRPARIVDRRHRRRARRPVAARLGRFRARRAGLSKTRRGGDRLGRRRGAGARQPIDGAPGQGRLLGHRDQARAGARARRLSGVHPQGDDRPLLHGLREKAARGAAAALSAIRHPQRAHRRRRYRGRRRRRGGRRLRVPAPLRHGRGALRRAAGRTAAGGVPRLCAGRRPPRSVGLSGAAAAGERRQFFVRLGGGRSERADRRHSAPAAEPDRRPRMRRATNTSRCRAIFISRSGKILPASSSATAPASTRCSPRFVPPRRLRRRPRR